MELDVKDKQIYVTAQSGIHAKYVRAAHQLVEGMIGIINHKVY